MTVVTKSINAAVTPVDSDADNGEFEVILSTKTKDRDGENLWLDEWKQPLPERIHIDGDHGRSLEKTVGSAVPRIEGDKLIGKGSYAGTDYAQMVRQLVNEGHINSVSVTYSETKGQKDGKVERELLNAAFVAIPANPEAIVLASKSAKDKAEGGISASGDNPDPPKHDDMVQAIHDAACHLGAQCANEIDADPGTADGANKSIDGLLSVITKSSSRAAGQPQESDEDSAAAETAEKSAVSAAADDSADDAVTKERLAAKARALAFLTNQSSFRSSHAQ